MVCKSGLDCLNGLCVFDNHGGTFCDCFLGWNGTYCDQFSCEDSSACVNGVCNDGVFCLCHTGWTGRFCNESRGCNSDSCIHGDCVVSRLKITVSSLSKKNKHNSEGKINKKLRPKLVFEISKMSSQEIISLANGMSDYV